MLAAYTCVMKACKRILAMLVLCRATLLCATVQFDQSDTALAPGFAGALGSIRLFQPVAQEFVPSLNSIDFFDLWIAPFAGSTAVATDAAVEIHLGSPFGQVIGVSQTVSLKPDLNGFTRFVFSESLPLTAGQTYSANLLTTDDNALQYGLRDILNDPYPKGDFYSGARQFTDAWFQEGTFVVPEPSVSCLIGVAVVLFCGRCYRSFLGGHGVDDSDCSAHFRS